ncbi:hypothetical protein evm_014695 [Chilo suppressalis]|nr:hypothetical protein evm_014695 [Chilo suppressalis]
MTYTLKIDIPTQVSICGKNKRLVWCSENLCIPLTCAQAGFPVPCPIVGPGGPCFKFPECICIEGYLKNSNGVCVPKDECTTCGGDNNAIPGCGFLCGRHCDNNVTVNAPCACNSNGCVCRAGYVYDDKQQKCVLPSQCTVPRDNEGWSPCVDYGCEVQNCAELLLGKNCTEPVNCVGGYVCTEGYVRGRNGTCILRSLCVRDFCPKPNEFYNPCPTPGTDDLRNTTTVWPVNRQCIPACICRPNYYRNSEGICVLRPPSEQV